MCESVSYGTFALMRSFDLLWSNRLTAQIIQDPVTVVWLAQEHTDGEENAN